MAGFVYIMSNTAFPDRIKIGKSKKDPTVDRVNELNKTGVPEPFHVEYYAFVPDETRLEKSVHDHFSNRRPNKKKEFFTVPVSEAVHQIRENAKQIGGIKFEEELFSSNGKKGSSKNEFRNNKNNEAFIDRINIVKVPYCLRVSEELKIYQKLIEHIHMPHSYYLK